jgi:hypothetical protein
MPKLNARYLKWRDGRPRFEPGPALRARGFTGRDLKDARGDWLRTRWQAAGAIEDILDDGPTPQAIVAVGRSLAPQQRTLSELFRLYRARPAYGRLAFRTRQGYESHMRLLEEWAGEAAVTAISRAAIEALLEALAEARGIATANAVHRTLNLLLNHAVDSLEWLPKNRAARLKLPQANGRLVLWSAAEINAVVAAADHFELPAVGDAVTLALFTGQNLADVLGFPPIVFTRSTREGVRQTFDGEFTGKRGKTGRPFFIPPFAGLTARIDAMRARQAAAWPSVTFATQLVANDGRAYTNRRFWDDFSTVRALASGAVFALGDGLRAFGGQPPLIRNLPYTPQPGLLASSSSAAVGQKGTKNFQDLRDTAITWLMEAFGGDLVKVCKVSGHSLRTAQAVIDKHYLVRQGLAADDAAALDRAFTRKLGG